MGQMGTNRKTVELQRQIKSLIAELGWSQNQLARNIYTELHEWDDDEEILVFQERLKKELQRPTTKPEKIEKYISIIVSHPDAKRLDTSFNKYVPAGAISDALSRGMSEISREIDAVFNKRSRMIDSSGLHNQKRGRRE